MTESEIHDLARESGFVWVSQWNMPTCTNKAITAFAQRCYAEGAKARQEFDAGLCSSVRSGWIADDSDAWLCQRAIKETEMP